MTEPAASARPGSPTPGSRPNWCSALLRQLLTRQESPTFPQRITICGVTLDPAVNLTE